MDGWVGRVVGGEKLINLHVLHLIKWTSSFVIRVFFLPAHRNARVLKWKLVNEFRLIPHFITFRPNRQGSETMSVTVRLCEENNEARWKCLSKFLTRNRWFCHLFGNSYSAFSIHLERRRPTRVKLNEWLTNAADWMGSPIWKIQGVAC